jgi:uncharacterized protein (DUF983 family)
MSKTVEYQGGIGFGGLLAILFIGLKLTGHIDWSWWWVLSPLWLPPAVLLAIAGVILALALLGLLGATVIAAIDEYRRKKRRARYS